jgi:L-histidine Nalpha-methyltransferase
MMYPTPAATNSTGRRSETESSSTDHVQIDVHLSNGGLATIEHDVREGLARRPKTLPPKYFYDARGSELFERITRLPEYYPTRAEQEILDRAAEEIVERADPEELVELGPGSARKTHALLDPIVARGADRTYVAVDVSESAVRAAADRLVSAYPRLRIHGVVGDFEQDLEPLRSTGRRRLIAFLGGTLGNFEPAARAAFLRRMRALMGEEDRLLIGTDLVKDREKLEAAYNDSAGVTAEFNRNVLHVINSQLGGELEPGRFDHVAFYSVRDRWIEMRLRAREGHSARINAIDMEVSFESGEEIRTEISCKFTRAMLAREYSAAGLELQGWYTDPGSAFALSLTAPR